MKQISNSRVLAVLLALTLCLGMIPAAWAEEPAASETPGAEPTEAVQEIVSDTDDSLPGETGREPVLLHGDEVVTADDGLQIGGGVLSYKAEHFSPFIVLTPNGDTPNAAASGTWGNLKWSLSADGTLTISGSGDMNGITYFNDAWLSCRADIKKVTIKSGVTSIGNNAFRDCSVLTSVTIPSTVTSIGGSVFYNCSGLKSITIPSGVEAINNYTFYNCSVLSSVTIPSSVKNIGNSAFDGCSSLADVYYGGSLSEWAAITKNNGNDLLWNATLHCSPATGTLGSLTWTLTDAGLLTISGNGAIPSSIYSTSQPWHAYSNWIKKIIIESGVTSIGDHAFDNCRNLTSATIPTSVKSIGSWAFQYCSSLTSVTLPSGVTSIGHYAFQYCSNLTNITIPSSVTNIGQWAFSDCNALISVKIPAGVTSISQYAFKNCNSLESVTIATGVTSIEYGAFSDCTSLKSITIPSTLTSINGPIFSGCSNLKTAGPTDSGCNIQFGWKESIPNNAFSGCSALTSVTIPSSVTSIGWGAFQNCSSLMNVTIPTGVTGIGRYVFSGCSSLTSITIPSGVIGIGDFAFTGCSSLTSVTIPEGVTNIGYNYSGGEDGSSVFAGCTALKSIKLPSTVTWIGKKSFFGCSALTSVSIPGGVQSIQPETLRGCSSLTSLTIREGTTEIGTMAFFDCGSLKTVKLPASVTSIADLAFSECNSITTVNYGGTAAQWKQIAIGEGNEALVNRYLGYPLITTQPASVAVDEGKTATFSVSASGGTLSYQWQYYTGSAWANVTNSAYTGLKTATMTVPAIKSRNGYQFRCKISNSAGTVYSDTATLTVNPKPVITAQPKSVTASEGKSATFKVTATGSGLSYQWQYRTSASGTWKASPAEGNKTATLTVPATTDRNGYQYRCKVTNSAGTVYSNTATLTVSGVLPKPTITKGPFDMIVSDGSTVLFKVTATGSGLSYQWQYRTSASGTWTNSPASGNKTAVLTVPATVSRDGYQYRCKVTNAGGAAYTTAVTLHVPG